MCTLFTDCAVDILIWLLLYSDDDNCSESVWSTISDTNFVSRSEMRRERYIHRGVKILTKRFAITDIRIHIIFEEAIEDKRYHTERKLTNTELHTPHTTHAKLIIETTSVVAVYFNTM